MWQRDQEYKKANYDQFIFRAKKGKREEYQQAAERFGLGQMEMFRNAIEEYIANHAGEDFKPTTQDKQPRLSEDEKALLEAFSHMPDDARKGFLKGFRILSRLSEEALAAKKQYFDLFRETTERQIQPQNQTP